MNDHPTVTSDTARNADLVAAYDTTDDTGPAFTDHLQRLGYTPPDRPEVTQWGVCVIVDEAGLEWLAWDAEDVGERE